MKSQRWSQIALGVVIGLALLAIDTEPRAGADEPPNVLLITADDLGLQLGCYGETAISTPRLDRLAAQGVRFEVAYVTQASCSPSRSSMFTGTYPHTNGQIGLANARPPFRMDEVFHDQTLPDWLKNAGYRTGILGKLHVNPGSEFPFDLRSRGNMRDVQSVADRAEDFMNQSANEPFFLMVNYTDPHAARTSRRSNDWYFPDQVEGIPAEPLEPGEAPAFGFQAIDDDEQLERVANYDNCVKRVDEGVGLLLSALKRSGQAEDTLVIFVGDHGPPFERGKTTCYEAGLRVPFLVRWPGVSEPMSSPALVSTVDIAPTILDAAGLEIPDFIQGHSLRPVLSDPNAPWRSRLAAEFHFHGRGRFFPRRAIRGQRYKLIHNLLAGQSRPPTGIDGDRAYQKSQSERYEGTMTAQAFATYANPPEFELYDLRADPNERNNLADRPELAEVKAALLQDLNDWRRATADPFLDPDYLAEVAEKAGVDRR